MNEREGEAPRTLVLGLGNDILADDGVGLRAARRVRELAGDRADFAEACVATIDLLSLITGYDRVIIIDAFISPDLPPGTPIRATPDDLPRGFGYRSFHTLTFREVLDLGEWLEYPMPPEMVIHGMAVDNIVTFGEEFSRGVAAAWQAWAEEIARAELGMDAAGSRVGRTARSL